MHPHFGFHSNSQLVGIMTPKRKHVPRHRKIATAQQELLKELPNAPTDVLEAARSCWACGYCRNGFKPTRAHIVASAHGGADDDPSNYLLLCEKCHREQPDGHPFEVQLVWLKNHEWYSYDTALELHILKCLKYAAKERGGPDVLDRWILENAYNVIDEGEMGGVESNLRLLMENGRMKSAGGSSGQFLANAAYSIVADFIKWADNFKDRGPLQDGVKNEEATPPISCNTNGMESGRSEMVARTGEGGDRTLFLFEP
jgi:hypothetical protein